MRWNIGSPERKIEAFIGAWGEKTGDIVDTEHLLELASRIFEVENTGNASGMMAAIEALGKNGRRARAQKNLKSVMGGEGRFSAEWGRGQVTPPGEAAPITEAALDRMMSNSSPQLIDGDGLDIDGQLDIDPAQLLRKVVSSVISSGRADILWEFPEVLAYFGSRIPFRHEVERLHNIDGRQFEAKANWPNVRSGKPS